jgi:hypothetical protein
MKQARAFNRRNVLAACCGLGLTVVTVAIGSFVLVRTYYPQEQLARVMAGDQTASDAALLDRMDTTSKLVDYLVFPLAAAVAGVAVGLIASSALLGVTVVSILPLAAIQLSAARSWHSAALSVGYAAIAYLTCRGIKAWRTSGPASS